MLDTLRTAAGTWVAKLLLGLLVLSFAVWGISGSIIGGAGSSVLTAGETKVSILEYRLAYDRQMSVMGRQFNTRLTREQAVALGIDQQVLTQLIAGAVLDEQASEMRLGLSADKLAALTAEDPAFRGTNGRFDRQQFEYVLRQVGMRPDDYLKNREQVAVRQQIVEAVADGVRMPDTYLRAMALYQGEDRTVDFIAIPRSTVEPVEAPSDAILSSYFNDNKTRYAAPEYRKIAYVKLEPSDIADEAAVLDEQVATYYNDHIDRYTKAEQRRIEQLVFADEAAAKAAVDKIRAGGTFDDAVAAEGRTMNDVILGTFTKSRIADSAIAEAAFKLDTGGVSDVVKGNFGYLLVRVTDIQSEEVQPLAAVSAAIRTELALDEAGRILLDVHDSYEDARAGGETMREAAAKQKLQVKIIDAVDRNGGTTDGGAISDIPEARTLLTEAFETDTGVENPPISIGATGFLFYEVEDIIAARDRTLDEVREKVAADWHDEQVETRLAERAQQANKKLADGGSFAEIATELGVEVQTRRGVKRDGEDIDLGKAGVAAAFGVARNGTGVVSGPNDGAQIVFKVTEVFEPAGAGPESVAAETRDALSSGMSDDLLDQLVAKLQAQYAVRINQSAINQALSF